MNMNVFAKQLALTFWKNCVHKHISKIKSPCLNKFNDKAIDSILFEQI
jgi:hypothetical protein